jgi:hypothetical protein
MARKLLITLLFTIYAIFLIVIVYINVSAYALSVGVAANSSYNMAMAQALNQKKSISNSYQINKEISVYSLYIPYISYLERHNKFFNNCNIVNNPKTLNSFIGGVNTKYGIDLYAMEYMQNKGELGSKNKMIKQNKVKKYMVCVAAYGLIIAQAIDNFHNSLSNGAGQVMSSNVYKVANNQYYNMVGQSLYNAILKQSTHFKTEYNLIKYQINNSKCVIYNKSLKCGGVLLNLDTSPKMTFGGLEWFDPQADFAGMNGMITIGYNKNSEYGISQDKNKNIGHVAEATNSLTNDLLNSLF